MQQTLLTLMATLYMLIILISIHQCSLLVHKTLKNTARKACLLFTTHVCTYVRTYVGATSPAHKRFHVRTYVLYVRTYVRTLTRKAQRACGRDGRRKVGKAFSALSAAARQDQSPTKRSEYKPVMPGVHYYPIFAVETDDILFSATHSAGGEHTNIVHAIFEDSSA